MASKKKKMIKAPISYIGSKRLEIQHIRDFISEQKCQFSEFVDVFGGAGNVALNMNDAETVVYNYIDPDMCVIFENMKNITSIIKMIQNYNNFEYKDKTEFHAKLEQTENGAFIKHAYSGSYYNHPRKCHPRAKKEYLLNPEYAWLQTDKFQILNESYQDIIQRYKNDEEALLYMDPPYIDKSNTHYKFKFKVDDYYKIKDFMDDPEVRCHIILHVNYTGFTRELFNNYYKKCYQYRYSSSRDLNVFPRYQAFFYR